MENLQRFQALSAHAKREGGTATDPIADIIGDYRSFAAQQRDRLRRGIDSAPYELSHLAVHAPLRVTFGHAERPFARDFRREGQASPRLEMASAANARPRLHDVTMRTDDPSSLRAASLLYGVPGLGFGISVPLVLAYLVRRGELPMTPFGWRLMGGPYEQIGTDRLTALGWVLAGALVGLSALDVVAAIWLREGRRRGALLGLTTTPMTLALGVAFMLPLLIAVAPLRALLVVAGRRGLH